MVFFDLGGYFGSHHPRRESNNNALKACDNAAAARTLYRAAARPSGGNVKVTGAGNVVPSVEHLSSSFGLGDYLVSLDFSFKVRK